MIKNKNGLLQSKGQEQKLEECRDVVFHLLFMMEFLISLGVIAQFMLLHELKSSDYIENVLTDVAVQKAVTIISSHLLSAAFSL